MGEEKKFCENCKFYSIPFDGWWIFKVSYPNLARCAHPTMLSPVDNTPVEFCEFMRNERHTCGPDAVLFEEK